METKPDPLDTMEKHHLRAMLVIKWAATLVLVGIILSIGVVIISSILAIVPPMLGISYFGWFERTNNILQTMVVILIVAVIIAGSRKRTPG